jgi:hypothetical protein
MQAINPSGSQLPSSEGLARALWEYMGYGGDYERTALGILFQAALKKPGGTSPLLAMLRSQLSVQSYPEWYRHISSWFWYRIYTTNVDDLVEKVFRDHGGNVRLETIVAPSEYEDRDAFLRKTQFVKLHGCLDQFDHGLTFDPKEYGRRAAERDVWYDHFVRDFSTRPTIFIGTELDEPLFWQYIAIRQHRTRDAPERRRRSYLVCPHISAAKRDALNEYNVKPIEATAQEFFEQLTSQTGIIFSRQEVLQNVDPSLEDLLALEEAGLTGHDRVIAEEFFTVFRSVKQLPPNVSTRSHFLLGSPPSWNDIFGNLDAEREVNHELKNVITTELVKPNHAENPILILAGAAGSGKSTIAKRASVMTSAEGFSVYWSDGTARFVPHQVVSYLRGFQRRVVLVFDDSSSDLNRIADLARLAANLDFKPVIVVAIRSNDLATKRYVFEDTLVSEIRVPDLSDPDIFAILETLDRNGLLGELRKHSPAQRADIFRQKARKQILVAMREATRGVGFDEIIADEFARIEPAEARLLYLVAAIPSTYHHFVSRGQLVASSDLPPNQTLSIVDDNLSGILIPREGNVEHLQIRHPVIASHIVKEIAPRELLARAYIAYLEILAHDLPPTAERKKSRIFRIYQDVINHRTLHEVFLKQIPLCREIYESVREHFVDDGHYWLQYGSYELEWGDLDFAENYLLQSESIMPNHPWVSNALGYLLMRKAVNAGTLMAANEYLNRGLETLNRQIEADSGRDPYPYHVLGSQMLAFLNRWSIAEERPQKLRELASKMQEGLDRHRTNAYLIQLVEDIKRAELNTTL